MVRFDNSSVSSNYVVGNYPMEKGTSKNEKKVQIFPTNESQNIDLQKAFIPDSRIINTKYLDNYDEATYGNVKAKLDGEYAEKMRKGGFKAFAMDLKCFFGTFMSVLKRDGVVEGGTGEMNKGEKEKETEQSAK